jgi:hypothetical protein
MGPALFVQNPDVGLEAACVHLEQYIIKGDAFLDRICCLGENVSMLVQSGSINIPNVSRSSNGNRDNSKQCLL